MEPRDVRGCIVPQSAGASKEGMDFWLRLIQVSSPEAFIELLDKYEEILGISPRAESEQ